MNVELIIIYTNDFITTTRKMEVDQGEKCKTSLGWYYCSNSLRREAKRKRKKKK